MGFFGKETPKSPSSDNHIDRRHYPRFQKNFILKYFPKDNPADKIETTQLKNISFGGMCFITCRRFDKGTELLLELQTPYLSEVTYLEGEVQESRQKVSDILFETRLSLKNMTPQAEFLIGKMVEFFANEEKKKKAENHE
ncbi:MAG: PilZ domain-containing protein [Candidatus Omnitrophica bacterium]|nr:PilZ domain-containing protein [Candidatus Omnitrophota bacterium]